jgi:hypothetical protein
LRYPDVLVHGWGLMIAFNHDYNQKKEREDNVDSPLVLIQPLKDTLKDTAIVDIHNQMSPFQPSYSGAECRYAFQADYKI